jgi:hypothetical protein
LEELGSRAELLKDLVVVERVMVFVVEELLDAA